MSPEVWRYIDDDRLPPILRIDGTCPYCHGGLGWTNWSLGYCTWCTKDLPMTRAEEAELL